MAQQEPIPQRPANVVTAITFNPIAPIVQEQPVVITGAITTNQAAPLPGSVFHLASHCRWWPSTSVLLNVDPDRAGHDSIQRRDRPR